MSRVYRSAPAAGAGGPPFLNAAVWLETPLPPAALKHEVLRAIEAALGRRRGPDKNQPREIDLDIALYDTLVVDDPDAGLRIPDPDWLRWPHLALPLADLDPERRHPGDGRRLAEIASALAGRAEVQALPPGAIPGWPAGGEAPPAPREVGVARAPALKPSGAPPAPGKPPGSAAPSRPS